MCTTIMHDIEAIRIKRELDAWLREPRHFQADQLRSSVNTAVSVGSLWTAMLTSKVNNIIVNAYLAKNIIIPKEMEIVSW